MKILVLGAGAWGTALAINAAAQPDGRRRVTLWARSAGQVHDMAARRENARYLPGQPFPAGLCVADGPLDGPSAPQHDADLVVIGSPMAALRSMLTALQDLTVPVVWICKGFESPQAGAASGLLGHEVCAAVAPRLQAGVLSGPSFAQEVAKGLPVALTLASQDLTWAREAAQDLHGQGMRVYASDDLIGVQLGGAIKNVLAIAAGVADTMALGANARAALITRGLAEAARLGQAMGAHPETFLGLATLGDLVLTATGDLSRNRRVGMGLAAGKTLDQVLADLGHVAEGVTTAPAIAALGERLQVELPITQAVSRLLAGQTTARQAMEELLTRDPTDEVRL